MNPQGTISPTRSRTKALAEDASPSLSQDRSLEEGDAGGARPAEDNGVSEHVSPAGDTRCAARHRSDCDKRGCNLTGGGDTSSTLCSSSATVEGKCTTGERGDTQKGAVTTFISRGNLSRVNPSDTGCMIKVSELDDCSESCTSRMDLITAALHADDQSTTKGASCKAKRAESVMLDPRATGKGNMRADGHRACKLTQYHNEMVKGALECGVLEEIDPSNEEDEGPTPQADTLIPNPGLNDPRGVVTGQVASEANPYSQRDSEPHHNVAMPGPGKQARMEKTYFMRSLGVACRWAGCEGHI